MGSGGKSKQFELVAGFVMCIFFERQKRNKFQMNVP